MSKEVKFGFIEDNNNKIKCVKIPKKYYKYIEDREQVCFENMKKLEEKLEWKKDCEIKAITIQATTVLQEKEKDFKSKITVLEKALELACERLKNLYCSDCGNLCDDWCVTEEDLKQECKLYYKCWNKDCILEQAKEMMKSE